MNLWFWKFYFGINVLLLIVAVIGEVYETTAPVGMFIADIVIYTIALLGVFSYFTRKHIFETQFWKYFFWFNVVYTVLYFLYALAPDAPLISYLSFLHYGEESDALIYAVVGTLIGIPYLYAMYQLSKGKYIETKTKEQELTDVSKFRWGMFQTALWGYSIVLLALLLLLTLIPSEGQSSTAAASGNEVLFSVALFSPILIFWLWVAWQHRMYAWNWWRVTLVLNSILFSGIVVFGSFFYDPSTTAAGETDEIDIIGLLQFLIIFAGLYVFGREQFHKIAVTKE